MNYRIPISVDGSTVNRPHTPVSVTLDFGALPPGVGVRPETIAVWRGEDRVPHRVASEFAYGDVGEVHFVIESPADLEYTVTVEEGERQRVPVPEVMPAIGIGDTLHHNTGRKMPLKTFEGPMITDLTGDGTPHLTDAIYWGSHYGWPLNVIMHRAGCGDLEFGPMAAVRYRKTAGGDPELISEDFYIWHHLVDWDGDGRLDLATVSSGGKDVKLYRNTGEREPTGCPVFELALTHSVKEEADGYVGLQMVDLLGDGRHHLVVGGNENLPGAENAPYTSYIQWHRNLAGPGEVPRFGTAERLRLEGGEEIRFEGSGRNFVFADLDGNGRLDLLYAQRESDCPLVWYRNLGQADGNSAPVFRNEGAPEGVEPASLREIGLGWANCGEMAGPIVNGQVYQVRVDAETHAPVFRSPRPIVTANPEINGGDQPWAHPCDWDGDGDLDLLAGDGYGYVQLWENTGTRMAPAFDNHKLVESEGEAIRIWRDGVFGGHHYHGKMGYTTPVYADWDGDGVPDLMVASETDRVFWFRNIGTAKSPAFGPMQQVEVEGYEETPERRERVRQLAAHKGPTGLGHYPDIPDEAFWWRQKVSVVDWNGDGLPDLVASDGGGSYCLYERSRNEKGELRLRKQAPFLYEDGEPVTRESIPTEVFGVDGIVVCDWRNSGVWDILVGTCYTVFYLENRGTNEEPAFARPKRLRLWGQELRSSRHGLLGNAVDWDGDGQLSWVSASENGFFYLFRRAALEAAEPPRVTVGRPLTVT